MGTKVVTVADNYSSGSAGSGSLNGTPMVTGIFSLLSFHSRHRDFSVTVTASKAAHSTPVIVTPGLKAFQRPS